MIFDDLQLSFTRKKGITLYTQIKDCLREYIDLHQDREPLILPPQRDLAKRLGVSRNTVSMAYAELEREGVVASKVGKGTVALKPYHEMENRRRLNRLSRNIEHSVEEALTLGYSLEEYRRHVETFIQDKKELLSHIRLVFVECNWEQLNYFTKHLVLDAAVEIIPLLLKDIRANPQNALSIMRSADIVVTSFYHIEEMETLIADNTVPIVGIYLQPEMSTIVNIARISETAKIGLLAASPQFLAEIRKTLAKMNIEDRRIREFYEHDNKKKLRHFIESVDTLIVSPSRKKDIIVAEGRKDIIEFLFAPDKGSANIIRAALMDLRQQRQNRKASDVGTDH
ncbi:MAG: GntR family transcriptional regulator [Sedimentisphaerales bacterium]|nr:GntR family transcriptional regulator [Sedimentisphaerales bacterium]